MQVAGIAASPELYDRQRFGGFYSTDATIEYVGRGLVAVARTFNWKQVAIITQFGAPFTQVRFPYILFDFISLLL